MDRSLTHTRLQQLTSTLNTQLDLYFELLNPPADKRKALTVLLRIEATQAAINQLLEQVYKDHGKSHLSVV